LILKRALSLAAESTRCKSRRLVYAATHGGFVTEADPLRHTRSTGEPDWAHGPAHVEGELVKHLAQAADLIGQWF
jgi:hypothetical protein